MHSSLTRFSQSDAFRTAKHLLCPAPTLLCACFFPFPAWVPSTLAVPLYSLRASSSCFPLPRVHPHPPTFHSPSSLLLSQLGPVFGGDLSPCSGVSFQTLGGAIPREAKATGQRRGLSGPWAEAWGKGCGWAHPQLPSGHPWLSATSPPQVSEPWRALTHLKTCPQKKSEMNLDALFQQIQLTEKQAGEKRRLIQQGQPYGWHLVGRGAALTTLNGLSIFQRILGKAERPHCAIVRGALLAKAWQAATLAASCQWHVFIKPHVLTGFCCVAAKFDINRSHEKINQIKEELSTAKITLETKVSRPHYNEMHYIYKHMIYSFQK